MATTKKTEVSYRALSPQARYEMAFAALTAAESAHYRLITVNPTADPSLADQTEAAAEEVVRLQSVVASAESDLPKADA